MADAALLPSPSPPRAARSQFAQHRQPLSSRGAVTPLAWTPRRPRGCPSAASVTRRAASLLDRRPRPRSRALPLPSLAGCATATFFNGNTAVMNLNNAYLYTAEVKDPAPRYSAATPLSSVYYGDLLTISQTTANWGITVALAFGMAITVLVYTVAHVSGGQLNPAVSFGLFLTGKLGSVQFAANVAAQVRRPPPHPHACALLRHPCCLDTRPPAHPVCPSRHLELSPACCQPDASVKCPCCSVPTAARAGPAGQTEGREAAARDHVPLPGCRPTLPRPGRGLPAGRRPAVRDHP